PGGVPRARPWGPSSQEPSSRIWQQRPSPEPWSRTWQQQPSPEPSSRTWQQQPSPAPWSQTSQQQPSPAPWSQTSQQQPWPAPSRCRPSQQSSSGHPPLRRAPSWRLASSLQPLVNLLDLHQVSDRVDIPAVLRVVFPDDRIADALESQAAQGVALVLLFTDFGLDLGYLQASHQTPAFAVASALAVAAWM